MPVVMRQLGAAAGFALQGDGQFLKSFDFEAFDGVGEISLTPDIADAMRFPDTAAAMTFRNRSPECKPRRPDGQPNRPLSAANWSIEPIE